MNAILRAIIHLLINKMCFSCYLRYIKPSKIGPFSQRYNVPIYSFHKGLDHDLVLIGLENISFLISIFVTFVPTYKQ